MGLGPQIISIKMIIPHLHVCTLHYCLWSRLGLSACRCMRMVSTGSPGLKNEFSVQGPHLYARRAAVPKLSIFLALLFGMERNGAAFTAKRQNGETASQHWDGKTEYVDMAKLKGHC